MSGSNRPETAQPKSAHLSHTASYAGQICLAEVLRPAVFVTETKRVMVHDNAAEYRNTPSELQWKEIKLQIEPSRYPYPVIPDTYQEVTETITIEPERLELHAIAADYRTDIRPLVTKQAYRRWKTGCHAETASACLEHVPAQHLEVKARMVQSPARIEQRHVPGKTLQVKRKVLLKRGTGHGTPLPARYEVIRIASVSKPWRIETTPIPAKYESIEVESLRRPEQVLRLPSLCKPTPATLTRLQQALLQRGYPTPINGQWDPTTQTAVLNYQQAQGLAQGAITLETLAALDL